MYWLVFSGKRPVLLSVCVIAISGRPRVSDTRFLYSYPYPLDASLTVERYGEFIRGSLADLGVAKDAYVASRGGWFSDRSTSFLASGRPVLHQETGFSEWLPTGAGVLAFCDLEQLVERVEELDRDYGRHARAARAIAEEHFEARTVLRGMLEAAGYR